MQGADPIGAPEPGRVLDPEELAGLLDLGGWPLPAVLDTACVRTGLHYQLRNGFPPASVTTARDGRIRLFMEFDTLSETLSHLPKFAAQFGVTVAELRRMLAEDWLPHIQVVKLPPSLRKLDPRAAAVRDKDADDYPAGALAALLSPCILLTRNHKDFAALGVRTTTQGVDAVMGVIEVGVGEMRMQAVIMVPVAPVRLAIVGGGKAIERIGPKAFWAIVIATAAAAAFWYCTQPTERRERVRDVAGSLLATYMDEFAATAEAVTQARVELHALLVPGPGQRSRGSAILRGLAAAPGPLSAQELAALVDEPLRPRVADLRAVLRVGDGLFSQAGRGRYELGRRYLLPDVA
jgi:hypothetical protein